jgi:hypothetical protein
MLDDMQRRGVIEESDNPWSSSVVLVRKKNGGVSVTFFRSNVTGSNDVILNEVGRSTALSLVGTYYGPGMRWDTSLGQLVVPLGKDSLGVWICMTNGLVAKFP